MKPFSRFVAVLSAAAVMSMIAMPAGMGAALSSQPKLACTTADEWTSLFDRRNQPSRTWLGADGIFTAALNGNDSFASANGSTKTFFIFSDTLMGASDSNGKVTSGWAMPSHSAAVLTGNTPNKDQMKFIYGNRGSMYADEHLFGERRWMLDCFVTGNTLNILGFSPSGDWKPENIDLYQVPIKNGEPDFRSFSKTDNIEQLFYRTQDDQYLYAFGTGVTMNTKSAGAPSPDGYIYLYGYRDAMKEFSRKDLIVARIKESDFPNFSNLRYWNGSSWTANIQQSAVVLPSVSCEMSVTPILSGPYKGKYIAVYTNNTQGPEIMYAIGDSPVGPFAQPVKFYQAPEHGTKSADGQGERYTYNAKAHPHLSSNGRLLVSYNCNIGSGEQYSVDYHPRFLWLQLDPSQQGSSSQAPARSSKASSPSQFPTSPGTASNHTSSNPVSSGSLVSQALSESQISGDSAGSGALSSNMQSAVLGSASPGKNSSLWIYVAAIATAVLACAGGAVFVILKKRR